jgi:hypothetical protein
MMVAATIEIVPTAPPWLLFARWLRFVVEVDGEQARVRWGTHAFVVAPGKHIVRVGTGAEFKAMACVEVNVAGNETVRLLYRPRLIKHLAGKLEIERLPAARVVPRAEK